MNCTQTILNIFSTFKDDGNFSRWYYELESEITAIYQKVAEQEKEWANYLFKDGSMIGLNAKILSNYVEYITNLRMEAIGLKPIFEKISNPLPWMNSWLVSDNVQVAPQESEITAYLVGQIDSSLSDDSFSDFEL